MIANIICSHLRQIITTYFYKINFWFTKYCCEQEQQHHKHTFQSLQIHILLFYIIIKYFMQIQNEAAIFVFNKVGAPFDASLSHLGLVFSQCVLGHLFVRGYRMFIKEKNQKCCILMKRLNGATEYLYLKFTQTIKQGVSLQELQEIDVSVRCIDDFKKKEQDNYRVLVCYLQDKYLAELTKPQYLTFKATNTLPIPVQNWGKPIPPSQQKMYIGQEDIQKIKSIIWTYIDTFGGKYKNSIYADLERHNPTSHNITKLINTVNWIIYCETAGKPYNQVETANWTCFEMQSREKLSCDRKDIVFTGSGQILMVHLLLSLSFQSLETYSRQHDNEVDAVLLQCRKSYCQREVKAYAITDELDSNNLIYLCKRATIKKQPQ